MALRFQGRLRAGTRGVQRKCDAASFRGKRRLARLCSHAVLGSVCLSARYMSCLLLSGVLFQLSFAHDGFVL